MLGLRGVSCAWPGRISCRRPCSSNAAACFPAFAETGVQGTRYTDERKPRKVDRSGFEEGQDVPLDMDIYKLDDRAIAEGLAVAYRLDFQTLQRDGVKYYKYWVNESSGTIFCLVEATDKEDA